MTARLVTRGRVTYADHGLTAPFGPLSRAVWLVTIHVEGCRHVTDYDRPLDLDGQTETARDLRRHGVGGYWGKAGHSPYVHRFTTCRTCRPEVSA